MSVVENSETIMVDYPSEAHVVKLDRAFQPCDHSALIILNQEITIPKTQMVQLWNSYGLKLCADGGANKLFAFFQDGERALYLPDFIVGDLDSLKPEVEQWYRAQGVTVIKQTTQYATDMQKCLDFIEIYYDYEQKEMKLDYESINTYDGLIQLHGNVSTHKEAQVLMIGAIDGRFDHTIQSISTLLTRMDTNPELRMFYLTLTDLIFVLPRGSNYLDYKDTVFHGSNCGLLPLAGETMLSTHGLKWDVKEWSSSLKGSVSSSNRFVGEHGTVIYNNNELIVNIEMDYDKM
jgi:thiamine pyrophosphokinase